MSGCAPDFKAFVAFIILTSVNCSVTVTFVSTGRFKPVSYIYQNTILHLNLRTSSVCRLKEASSTTTLTISSTFISRSGKVSDDALVNVVNVVTFVFEITDEHVLPFVSVTVQQMKESP